MNDRSRKHTLQESDSILSTALSRDNKFLIVNTSFKVPEIHLWSLATFEIVKTYRGHVQEKFILRCCLGGIDDRLISCGGEDGKVCIWHRNISQPLSRLSGHSGAVNVVAWHPKDPNILVSGSDDNTIRVWGTTETASSNPTEERLGIMEEEKSFEGDSHNIMEEEDEDEELGSEEGDDLPSN
eukprot:TRINITY_DN3625_c0_g2_i1.p1 TRINITY_DN3625_c0_g2~~TRINITY_DN3625_c0_g2_i1.p1  ORF type:complete len:183 (+),score=34.14 TRINITY_DN3625_c0_g2_i1:102-650(+)